MAAAVQSQPAAWGAKIYDLWIAGLEGGSQFQEGGCNGLLCASATPQWWVVCGRVGGLEGVPDGEWQAWTLCSNQVNSLI